MQTTKLLQRFSLLLGCLLGSVATADFPEPFNTEPTSEQSLMAADEAAKKMILPIGFEASVFASEPDVQNPIAMSWDARGRLWVAENYTYAERTQRFQLDLRDRVLIFDGTDSDRFKTRTVFADNLQRLSGIEVGHDGVWLMCPPQLIFIPDRDQNDVPDNAGDVVLDGFEVAQANHHNFANGLRLGPDGWLYGRCGGSCPGRIGKPGSADHERLALEGGMWRYHPVSKNVEVLTTGTTNPWGHDWNNVGEAFFVNTVNGHLWHLIPGAHFKRPFTLDPNHRTYELIDFHADHWHFDTGGTWHQSRDGVANAFGGGHAHCGAMIYQGENWPAIYRGNLFTLNFHGRRANQEILHRDGSGYIAKHGDDFLIAEDTWFRGMELSCGPDGGVFVLDWSDAGECHEHTGVHRKSGRIFKISYQGSKSKFPENLTTWTQNQLVAESRQDDWLARQARLELERRSARGDDMSRAIDVLQTSLESSSNGVSSQVQSLLTLHRIGGTDDVFLASRLHDSNEHVRLWALRLLTENWTIDDALGPVWRPPHRYRKWETQSEPRLSLFCQIARDDPSALVRLTLASTLQRFPVAYRPRLARALVTHGEDGNDKNLPLMIWYGLIPVAQENPAALVEVAKACRLPTTLRLISRCLAEEIENHPDSLNGLLDVALDAEEDDRVIVLKGIAEGLKGWRSATKPLAWDRLMELDSPKSKPLIRELSVVFGDGRALDELRSIATGKTNVDFTMRLAALETLIQCEPDDLRDLCKSLLNDARMNLLAARGLSKFDDPEIGKTLVARYRNFRAPVQPQVISILVSRASFATEMLRAIRDGKIPRRDLSAYQVRQIHSLGDPILSDLVREVWGDVQDTPAAKQRSIDWQKKSLTKQNLANADKRQGRELFRRLCQNCHRLYGEGATVGPDLTGTNRDNLDYLLANIIDPSAVVDKDFRMSILLLEDDRIVNGLVTAETERTITLQTATETLTIRKDAIQTRNMTAKSPMPDGLFDTLTPIQIRDLVGYLIHPNQVPLP